MPRPEVAALSVLSGAAEPCLLLGIDLGELDAWPLDDDLAELAQLCQASGGRVVGQVRQRLSRGRADPGTLIGAGKVGEVAQESAACGAAKVLVSRELTPRQQRNLEREAGLPFVDRTQLILDIFARRAVSHEGRLQVELAQLTYLLPRLSGAGPDLSRQGGGIGTRGPGETQLETDRRRVRRRIRTLRLELERVRASRDVQRAGRSMPTVALVGYTNAGKSTLLNALTGAGALAADALFATLDLTTRLLHLPGGGEALVTDTVGFVHDLPSELIAAFRATLEEVVHADLLLHVVDAGHPKRREQIEAVERVLAELGAGDRPMLLVWNKADTLPPEAAAGLPRGLAVSALTGLGLDALRGEIAAALARSSRRVRVLLGYGEGALLDRVHRQARVVAEEYRPDGIALEADCPPALAAVLEERGSGS